MTYEYFAYDEEGRASADDAPPLPRSDRALDTWWVLLTDGPSLVVSAAPSGPCTTLLARIPIRSGERRAQAQTLMVVLVSVGLAVLLSGIPLVSRLRRLEARVRASADSQYAEAVPIEGRDEIAAVAAAFNEARDAVRAQMAEARTRAEDLRRHVANTAHDVGTPLTTLQGTLAELERAGPGTPATVALIHDAMREAHYMASLLRNLSTVVALDARGEASVVTPIDLSVVVDRVVARHAAMARAHEVSLNHATPGHSVVVEGDPTLAEQLLSNLVDNAIRYNRPGGKVAVVLDIDRGGAFDLSVTDDGPGVPEEELTQLTRRWYRGDQARTRRPEGTGLGLAIAAEAAARLSMRLEFVRPGHGGFEAWLRPAVPQARADAGRSGAGGS